MRFKSLEDLLTYIIVTPINVEFTEFEFISLVDGFEQTDGEGDSPDDNVRDDGILDEEEKIFLTSSFITEKVVNYKSVGKDNIIMIEGDIEEISNKDDSYIIRFKLNSSIVECRASKNENKYIISLKGDNEYKSFILDHG